MPNAEQPSPPPRRRLSDPTDAAQISESDIDAAIAQWRKDAPPALRELLDAEIEQSEDRPPI